MTQTKGFILLSYKSCHPDQKGWPRRTYLNNFHTPVAHAILYLVCPGFPGLAWDLPHLSRRDPATLGGLTTCIWKLPDELRRAKSGSWRGQGTLGTPGQDRCQELPGRARGFPDPSRRKLPGKLPRRPSQPAVGTARKHERCGGGTRSSPQQALHHLQVANAGRQVQGRHATRRAGVQHPLALHANPIVIGSCGAVPS